VTSPQIETALEAESNIRSERFEKLNQLHRQRWTLEQRIELAEIMLADSDREIRRLRKQRSRLATGRN
jgi:hypothetical protein